MASYANLTYDFFNPIKPNYNYIFVWMVYMLVGISDWLLLMVWLFDKCWLFCLILLLLILLLNELWFKYSDSNCT